jgi:glutaredoxin-related protein
MTSAQSTVASAPSAETNVPSTVVTSAPGTETSAPSSETSAPSTETSAPSTLTEPNYHEIGTLEEFKTLIEEEQERFTLLGFWAEKGDERWNKYTDVKKVKDCVKALTKKYPHIRAIMVKHDWDDEELQEIGAQYEIETVPTFLVMKGHTVIHTVTDKDTWYVEQAVKKNCIKDGEEPPKPDIYDPPPQPRRDVVFEIRRHTPTGLTREETDEELDARIHDTMHSHMVVLFMRGTPEAPKDAFGRKVVQILNKEKEEVRYTVVDVMKDDRFRKRMMIHNDWWTFPQIVIDGDVFGDLDILKLSCARQEFWDIRHALYRDPAYVNDERVPPYETRQ